MAKVDSMWIFGYGSLIFYPNIQYSQRISGRVRGYIRRFWQESTDHRGTPESPGRVATLVEEGEGEVWGFAYEVCDQDKDETIARLNVREKCGYELKEITFYPESGGELNTFCYMGTADNPEFLKFEEIGKTAEVIARSVGASGTNRWYLDKLVAAVREHFPLKKDEYLEELSDQVKSIVQEST